MKILLLGSDRLKEFLKSHGDEVEVHTNELSMYYAQKFDWIISHGYRYIINKFIVDDFRHKAINLHISYLPWNRGADPNYWSFKDKTPKGVTIHEIDYGVDDGRILYQTEVTMRWDDTLATSYARLQESIEALFRANWLSIRGSYHKRGDMPELENGWDTLVSEI